ncbi:peptide/nickel transport system permease protein [Kitasatospora sp. SolWspMP-SS2h]|uniref:ABC transporter permease n=1 Tax=Kitasatospora sp. SolWspMP-SS2h TaxID=1305729 RepID=UPI000DBA4D8D|nr:ABC transporter permease [Kitasatospora sp. SolWspMP-SS2h]RAJ41253.1 peptide/nickel transport system permease protein [Kitasatospora sp. SolWspMP-SS2h]
MTTPTGATTDGDTSRSGPTSDLADNATADAPADPGFRGLSPGKLMWRRFLRDRTGVVSACVVLFFVVVAVLAPVISMLYGKNPETHYGQEDVSLLTDSGLPTGPNGGMSGDFWFGLEPGLGRDVFTLLIYGIRTSLIIAVATSLLTTVIGVALGIAAGYLGGKFDYFIGRIIDVLMSFPSQIFLIATMPVVTSLLVSPDEKNPSWLPFVAVTTVLSLLGWMGLARILRGVALSLREREFIEAAKVTGASPMRIIFKEILPNLWTPILVQSTLALPAFVTAEAGLSYLGVGVSEPTPDWGRMIADAANYLRTDVTFLLFPGLAMVVFVLAFNLLGDSVRDAFDPKTNR